METRLIRVLVVEDNPLDLAFLRRTLQKIATHHFELEPVKTLAEGIARLAAGGIDVVLLDLSLPDSRGLETFRAFKASAHDTPVIILSGLDDETLALEAVHAGAEDYLVKGRVDSQLITRAIIYALERTESRGALTRAEERYRGIFENSATGIFQTTPEGRYLDVNPALVRLYGYDSREDLISHISDISRLIYVDRHRREEFIRVMQREGAIQNFESQVYRKDGSIIWIAENARAVRDGLGAIQYYEGMVEDITARKEAEEKLRFSETRFRSVWQNSSDGMRLTDEHGITIAVNPSFCRIVGMTAGELVGQPFTVIYASLEDRSKMTQAYQQRFAERRIDTGLERHVLLVSGKGVDVELSNSFVEMEEGKTVVLSVFRDITIRRQAEERERMINAELARSQAELRKKNDILEEDLKMAREIQQAILPQQHPTFPLGAPDETSLLRFCHQYLPTGEVGGDFFNILPLSENRAGVFICDVMGHGVRSALVTAMVRGLVEELRPIAMDPGELLTRINSDLRAILWQTGTPLFTTACYLVADLKSRQLLHANAGHPKPLLIHRDAGKVEMLTNADGKPRPALGLFADSVYPTATRPLNPGDFLMLFTDGLYEVEGAGGEQYSVEMLAAAAGRHTKLSGADMIAALLEDVRQFAVEGKFADDVCLVGMEVSEKF